jgi:hypothetical protein
MKRAAFIIAGIFAVLLFLQISGGTQKGIGDNQSLALVPSQTPCTGADFGKIPLSFIPNEGQVDGPAAFYVQGRDKTIYFAAEGLTFVLSGQRGSPLERSDGRGNSPVPRTRKARMYEVKESGDANGQPTRFASERWVVKLDFIGANPGSIPVSLGESGAVISYFKGKPANWKKGLQASSRIIYRELWPGIDLIYCGTVGRMKSEFIVHPGADPSRIKLAYRGAESVGLTEEGRLAVATPAGGFEDDVPVAWQEVKGAYTDVFVAYVLDSKEAGSGPQRQAYGFEVGEYDKSLPLVLDPTVLVYCGYIGGLGWEKGSGIAVDAAGNAYITGDTSSLEATFPVMVGPDLTYNGDPEDAFVVKVKADGTGLAYCGYIGGGGLEEGYGIAVDSSGNAYVTGQTSSSDFPVTPGSGLTFGGSQDAFVAKVKADGSGLAYCGCIGGSGDEVGSGIAVDGSGNAYVTGWTSIGSAVNDFPVTVGPDLIYHSSGDAFVAKVKADGTGFVYCGYIGGWAIDNGDAIAVDGQGNAYVTGKTASDDFPVKVGPDLAQNGWFDAFVAKVKADGTGLVYCGYIGGVDDEEGRGIAVDGSGNAYVTGYTYSTDLPVVVGPGLTHTAGSVDAFVAKVKADGTKLVYCGYIGGDGNASGNGIAVDSSGNAYIAGGTDSSEATFPVRIGPDLTYNGLDDAFVAKVKADGTGLVYCGYIGGENNEYAAGIAVDGSGNAYVTGQTDSTETTLPVTVGPDLTYNGNLDYDAFVAKVPANPVTSKPQLSSLEPAHASVGDPNFLLTVIGTDFAERSVVRWDGSNRPTTYITGSELDAEIAAADLTTGKFVKVTVGNPDGGLSNALLFSIDNPVPGLVSLSTTHVTGGGSGFTLTLQGTNFVPESVVRWNGSDRTTTYINATELQTIIAAADIATGGDAQVTVYNPAPAGGTSGVMTVQVSSYTLASTPTSATVTAGQTATYTIQLAPQYGSFDSSVSFSCAGLPSKCAASFSPASGTPGALNVTTTLTLTTKTSSSATGASLVGATGFGPPALGLCFLTIALLLGNAVRRWIPWRIRRRCLAVCALVCAVILIGSCGGGGGNNTPPYTGTPKGTYQVSVLGTSGNMTASTTVTLIVQ